MSEPLNPLEAKLAKLRDIQGGNNKPSTEETKNIIQNWQENFQKATTTQKVEAIPHIFKENPHKEQGASFQNVEARNNWGNNNKRQFSNVVQAATSASGAPVFSQPSQQNNTIKNSITGTDTNTPDVKSTVSNTIPAKGDEKNPFSGALKTQPGNNSTNSGARSETASIQAVFKGSKDYVEKKIKELEIDAPAVKRQIQEKITALEAEKEKYSKLGKTDLVNSIDKKIEAYKKTNTAIDKHNLSNKELNSLHNFIMRDTDAFNPETKIVEYDNVAKKLNNFVNKKNGKAAIKTAKGTYRELKTDEQKLNDAISQVVLYVKEKAITLDKEIIELERRNREGDKEKAQELKQQVETYNNFRESISGNDMVPTDKRMFVEFLQNDNLKTQYLADLDLIHNNNLEKSQQKIAEMLVAGTLDAGAAVALGKGLAMKEAYGLFSDFGELRNSIPGLVQLKPTDDIDAYVNSLGVNFSDEEKKKIEDLKALQGRIKNFNQGNTELVSKINKSLFIDKIDELNKELVKQEEELKQKFATIENDANLNDEQKALQKSELEKENSIKSIELKRQINNLEGAESEFKNTSIQLDEAKIAELSTQIATLSLAKNSKYAEMLQALSKDFAEGRGVGRSLDIDLEKIKDTSLMAKLSADISKQKDEIKDIRIDQFKGGLADLKDTFIGKSGETALEREERFKKMDTYFASGTTGFFTKVFLFFFWVFEYIVNFAEKLPVLITRSQEQINKGRTLIFLIIAGIIFALAVMYNGDGVGTIELNQKLYSMQEYAVDSASGKVKFADDNVKMMAGKISILVFLMSLVVIYQVVIELMSRYNTFLRLGENKGVEGFMISILKSVILLLFVGFIFKIFI